MRKYVILRKKPEVRGGEKLTLEAPGSGKPARVVFERLTELSAASIAREPEVEAIAPAMATCLIRPKKASADAASDAWGLDATGARSSTYSGQGVTVAVLDTGIDASHPAFDGVDLDQMDFSGDGDGDVSGHGTHCAGTIFGRDVDGVRIGVARGVERALIGKVLRDDGRGDTEMIIRAIDWAVSNKADIISMSLGFDFPGMVQQWVDDNWPVDLAVSNALEAYRVNLRVFDEAMNLTKARGALGGGALVIAAAGNESKRDEHPDWRIGASLPAAAEHVLSIGAVGRDGDLLKVADFSNSSPLLSGPGVDILSAKTGGGLIALSGTSMACPHVAGLAALWWEKIRKERRKPSPLVVSADLISGARRDRFGPDGTDLDIGQGLAVAP